MIGQDAMCPYCGEAFRLRREDSVEYKQEQEEYFRRKEEQMGKKWLNWAIAIAVVVALGVGTLVIMAISG